MCSPSPELWLLPGVRPSAKALRVTSPCRARAVDPDRDAGGATLHRRARTRAVYPLAVPALQALSQGTITGLGIVAVVVLVLLSAFFASAEIAIFSLGDHRIGALRGEGVRERRR